MSSPGSDCWEMEKEGKALIVYVSGEPTSPRVLHYPKYVCGPASCLWIMTAVCTHGNPTACEHTQKVFDPTRAGRIEEGVIVLALEKYFTEPKVSLRYFGGMGCNRSIGRAGVRGFQLSLVVRMEAKQGAFL